MLSSVQNAAEPHGAADQLRRRHRHKDDVLGLGRLKVPSESAARGCRSPHLFVRSRHAPDSTQQRRRGRPRGWNRCSISDDTSSHVPARLGRLQRTTACSHVAPRSRWGRSRPALRASRGGSAPPPPPDAAAGPPRSSRRAHPPWTSAGRSSSSRLPLRLSTRTQVTRPAARETRDVLFSVSGAAFSRAPLGAAARPFSSVRVSAQVAPVRLWVSPCSPRPPGVRRARPRHHGKARRRRPHPGGARVLGRAPSCACLPTFRRRRHALGRDRAPVPPPLQCPPPRRRTAPGSCRSHPGPPRRRSRLSACTPPKC